MIKKSTALAAVLVLFCFACNEESRRSVQSEQMTLQRTNKIPPPPKTSNSEGDKTEVAKVTISELVPPVIKKDEEIKNSKEGEFNTEDYDNIIENKFLSSKQEPLSTFSIDVDEASYSNVRRYLQNGSLPPAGAVRIEEMVNYFDYEYPQPQHEHPFSVITEIAECPWNTKHKLVHIGLQGKTSPVDNLPNSNFVFLVDVSGSMDEPNKLPLVQTSLNILTDQLRERDKVAIVVYAGNAGLVLPSTNGSNKIKIKEAINNLEAGGSTAGGEGIQLAYKIARENFIRDGNNRVILATDGDFNIGPSSDDDLVRLIEKKENPVFS